MAADKKANPRITKQVFEEFEKLRTSGECNMGDINSAYTYSARLGLYALHQLIVDDLVTYKRKATERDYTELLQRQGFYYSRYKREE